MVGVDTWKNTWGTIDWEKDSEEKLKEEINRFFFPKIDFNMTNEESYTKRRPLHYASVFVKSEEIIAMMIRGGADINLTDTNGATPLHYAAYSGNTKIVEYLIKRGVNVSAMDFLGRTSYSLAKNSKTREIIKNADKIRAEYLKDHPEDYIENRAAWKKSWGKIENDIQRTHD